MKLQVVLAIVALGTTRARADESIEIVVDGQARAAVVLAREVDSQTEAAAQELVRYVKQATGAELPVIKGLAKLPASLPGRIYVGQIRSELAARQLAELQDLDRLDEDGFVIHGVNSKMLVIAGPTTYGTEFGVYEFLERYVGVRWLLPGPDGDDVPSSKSLRIPVETVRQQPVMVSRLFSGLKGSWQTRWARLNRMHGRVSFHHYLLHILPPETYTKTNPEFFPMKDSKTRYLPPTNDTHGWQPCFSEPGTIQQAIKNITRHFDQHPDATSCSLGVNDSSGHCRCPKCLERVPAEPNFLGRADYSDFYYDWCNQVIEGVLQKHPDKWFGCLAYSEVAAPPKRLKVHPRLIPFMTYDRMKWIHPEIRTAGHQATEAWAAVSPSLGWYDYIYGTPYCLPRVYFQTCQDYIRYGSQQQVRASYAELYPNWGEGPKPYVFLKLWWNPEADVDALLQEWYQRCVGPEAAPLLAQYYSIWERFWTEDILSSEWFTTGGQYLRFNSPEYLADVREEDIHESRRLLDQCLAKCQTDKQRARARLLERRSSTTRPRRWPTWPTVACRQSCETEAQALQALDSAETR